MFVLLYTARFLADAIILLLMNAAETNILKNILFQMKNVHDFVDNITTAVFLNNF